MRSSTLVFLALFALVIFGNVEAVAFEEYQDLSLVAGRHSSANNRVAGHCNCEKHRRKRQPPKGFMLAEVSNEPLATMAHSKCCKKKKTITNEEMSMPSSTEEDEGPGMNMYFTDQMPFYLLFKFWVPSTPTQYWFAVLMMLLTGVAYEGIKTFQAILEHRWALQRSKCYSAQDFMRASLTFLSTVISYALMLAAMCFNTGIFFAVCGGFALGVLIFGRYKPYSPLPERDCCGS